MYVIWPDFQILPPAPSVCMIHWLEIISYQRKHTYRRRGGGGRGLSKEERVGGRIKQIRVGSLLVLINFWMPLPLFRFYHNELQKVARKITPWITHNRSIIGNLKVVQNDINQQCNNAPAAPAMPGRQIFIKIRDNFARLTARITNHVFGLITSFFLDFLSYFHK